MEILNFIPKWALGLIFGAAFGFILHRVGATQPDNIVNMLRLRDLRILRFMLLAIVVGVIAAAGLKFFGLGNFDVKTAYILGVAVGGAIFGIGFAVAGFCPGTSLVAIGEGRKDAWLFSIGGLLGAFIYSLAYAGLKPMLIDQYNLGKVTIATYFPSIPEVAVAAIFAGVLAIFAFRLKGCDEK